MADIEIRIRRPRHSRYVYCSPIYYTPVRYVRVPEVIREVETIQPVQSVVEYIPKVTVRRWNEIVPREEVRRWNEIVPREEVVRSVEVRRREELLPPVTTVRTYEATSSYETQ
ncbi:hypothetical protein BpHYR1_006980 [Brachionus plicatilis]|uniref:Uncharacterized protein n=1 Tax=Brachionus plicatilis TaxID=10195 RepID=A0A3M7QG31_BRAPC|nr:hypothetical protein BpHYR1_006980 [Brachionus plicatilis]